jgi:hypothetical protein
MSTMRQVSELLEGVRRNITEGNAIGDVLSKVQVGQTIKVHTDSRQKPWIGKVVKASDKHGSWSLKGLRGGGAAIDRNIHRDDLFFLTLGGGKRLQHASEMVTKIEP